MLLTARASTKKDLCLDGHIKFGVFPITIPSIFVFDMPDATIQAAAQAVPTPP